MRAFNLNKIFVLVGLVGALTTSILGCTNDDKEMASSPAGTAGLSGSEDVPPATPGDICTAIATFPGWGKLGAAPETDAEGRRTVWYVAIPTRSEDEVNAMTAAGIPSEFIGSVPEVQDPSVDGGTPDPGQKSLCFSPVAAEIEWALVPGVVLNQIVKTQASATAPTWEAIVVLPVPSQLADPSLTFDGTHPLSDETAAYLGF